MKTAQLFVCAISVAAASACPQLKAQNLSTELIEIVPGLTVEGTLDNGGFIGDYRTGVNRFQDYTNSTIFDAFCVEPLVSMAYGDTATYQIQDISLLPQSDTVALLVGGYLASGQTDEDAAAVQWAIWEVTTETLSSPSLLDGNVRVITPAEQPTADLANLYLADANTFTPANLIYLTSDSGQNLVSWNVVPEPGTAGLVALSALCFFRRRR